MKVSVKTKIGEGLVLALIIVIILGTISYRHATNLIQTANWVARTH